MIVVRLPRKARRDFVETEFGQDGDAVEGLLSVDRNVITECFERLARKCLVDALDLLQAGDIRLALLEPGDEGIDALLDRIDVPGGDSHLHPQLFSIRIFWLQASRSH
jgi:hypothetical protein